MILVDNIFSIDTNDNSIHLSKEAKKKSDTVMLSHGHFDHMPGRVSNRNIISTPETFSILSARKSVKNSSHFDNIEGVQMLDAGHTIGSRMFYFKESDMLFTGDFRTVKSYCGQARARRAKTLIIEATFGDEKYIFPNYEHVKAEVRDYVLDNRYVHISAYSFGKSQEIAHILEKAKIPFSVSENVKKLNDSLGLKYEYENSEANVHIGRENKNGHRSIGVSGWAVDPRFKYQMGLDEAFPLSDHADYSSLIHFIHKVNPEKIYAFHGFAESFTAKLRKAGFDAEALGSKQKLLNSYI